MVMKRDMAALLVALSVYRVASTGTPLPGEGRGGGASSPCTWRSLLCPLDSRDSFSRWPSLSLDASADQGPTEHFP